MKKSNTLPPRSLFVFLACVLVLASNPVPSFATTETPVLEYNAVTDMGVRAATLDKLPKIANAGSSVTDPDFGTKILRVTDGNVLPNDPNASFVTSANGNVSEWSADSTKFWLSSLHGAFVFYNFDATHFTATPMKDPTDPTKFFNFRDFGPQFSYSNPHVIYGTTVSTTKHLIEKYDTETHTYTTVVDIDSITPTQFKGWTGYMNAVWVDYTDRYFGVFIPASDGLVMVYDSVTQKTSILDMYNSTYKAYDSETFVPLNTLLGYQIHGMFLDRTGRYVLIGADLYSPKRGPVSTPTVSNIWVWDSQSGTVRFENNGLGHEGIGFGQDVTFGGTQACCDSDGWETHSFFAPESPDAYFGPVPGKPDRWEHDGHPSWNNNRSDMKVPIIQEVFVEIPKDLPSRALDDEIVAVATDGSNRIWRFSHTWDIYDGSFWTQPRSNVSQNGKYTLFSSNWMKTLGKDSDGNNRVDTFIVELNQTSAIPVIDTEPPVKPVFPDQSPLYVNRGLGTLAGVINLTPRLSDNVGVVGTRYYVDGKAVGLENTTKPFEWILDTHTLTNGFHSAYAYARDAQGNGIQSDTISLQIDNENYVGSTTPATPTYPSSSDSMISTSATTATAQTKTEVVLVQHTSTAVSTTPLACNIPVISGNTNINGQVGQVFTYRVTTSTTTLGYFISRSTPLPVGLTFDTTTGVLTGTPQQAGSYPITFIATNTCGTDSKTLSLNIADAVQTSVSTAVASANNQCTAPSINSSLTASGQVQHLFSYTLTTSTNSSTTPIIFSIATSTPLPQGISFENKTGVFSGIPQQIGSFSIAFVATNICGVDTKTLLLNVADFVQGGTTQNVASNASSGGGGGGGGNYTPPAQVALSTNSSVASNQNVITLLSKAEKSSIVSQTVTLNSTSTTDQNTSSITHNSLFMFTRNLSVGYKGEDVRQLQIYLNSHGFVIARSGTGSKYHETNYFGIAAKNALIKFQKQKKIRPASGYFGTFTRSVVNTNK